MIKFGALDFRRLLTSTYNSIILCAFFAICNSATAQSIENSGKCNANIQGVGNDVTINCNGKIIDPTVSITLRHEDKQISNRTLAVTLVISNQSEVPLTVEDFKFGMFSNEVSYDNFSQSRRSPGELRAGSNPIGDSISPRTELRVSLTYDMPSNALQYWRGRKYGYMYAHLEAKALLTSDQEEALPWEFRHRTWRYEWLRWNIPISANKSALNL